MSKILYYRKAEQQLWRIESQYSKRKGMTTQVEAKEIS
jgi:hypothetical protein